MPDFEEPQYSVVENGTFVEVCVLIDGILERNLTLSLSSRDQTAVGEFTTFCICPQSTNYPLSLAPEDYVSTLTTLFFDISTARACTNLPITDNNVTEPQEEFCVVLTPEGGDPADPSNPKTTVAIVDDDSVTIGFEMEVYSTREDQGSVQVCALIREGALDRDVTVLLITREDSAQESEDFIALSYTVTFDESTAIQCVNISLTNDDSLENIEQFLTLLEAEDNVPVILSPERAVVRIMDDDGEC